MPADPALPPAACRRPTAPPLPLPFAALSSLVSIPPLCLPFRALPDPQPNLQAEGSVKEGGVKKGGSAKKAKKQLEAPQRAPGGKLHYILKRKVRD